jgi:hypothetical protein
MVTLLVVCGLVCWGVAGGAVQYMTNGGPDVVVAGVVAAGMALAGGVFFYVAWWVVKRR